MNLDRIHAFCNKLNSELKKPHSKKHPQFTLCFTEAELIFFFKQLYLAIIDLILTAA